ncbi:leucyl/phenylalanyl-tRNA--protein transferase [Ningiella sp. W23]|uniref:leucyl/phenylalanyl-tRNA--protein transferase n=1 Tax=Ningiella sp. W23 TaxID=3023715 RepID=UPI0037574903
MLELFKLNDEPSFPSVDLALEEPNGLLAFGGDLSVKRLQEAYKNGIFPWFSVGEPLLWWSPNPRGIIYTADFRPSKSLLKSIRKYSYHATINHAFNEVIERCAKVQRTKEEADNLAQLNATWIGNDMISAYQALHQSGSAQSIEIWDANNNLVGGLYGVTVGEVFCGESMFHLQTDASKAAFLALVSHMRSHKLPFIDCQMQNPHLASLGCIEIPRSQFKDMLGAGRSKVLSPMVWSKQTIGFDL